MEVQVKSGDILGEPSDLAVLASFEDRPLPGAAAALLEPQDFTGKNGQTRLLYPRGSVAPRRLYLLGLGKAEEASAETIRRASAMAINEAQKLQVKAVTLAVNGDLPLDAEQMSQAFAEGAELGNYRFWRYRTGLSVEQTFEVERITVLARASEENARAGVIIGQKIASGVNFARDLVNGPGYAMHPPELGEEAVKLGQRTGIKVTVLDMAQLTEQGFGGILAVGRGSEHEPRFISMEYGTADEGTPTICLVGKGLTFDSGGLSLKPADAMTTMKSDMAGAAAVYGAMQNAVALKLPLHLVGLISAAENMPSSNAYRPGDVIKTLSGKTIEVLNTDAEGRIILSDALFYAQRYNPAAIVEFSTLTGAIIITFGAHASGMMGTDQALLDKLSRAGEATGERVWQLPFWDEYHEMIKSEIADIKNMAGRPAGSITAGAFLAAFVGDCPFAHIDIAGTAWVEQPTKPYETTGATGTGVRLVTEFLRRYR